MTDKFQGVSVPGMAGTDGKTDEGSSISPLRPLTRTRKDSGAVYTREPDVEAQVRRLSALSDRARRERLFHGDRSAADYVREEALVYFLRDYAGRGEEETAWQIAETLVSRIAGHVQRKLARWRLSPEDADDCARDLFTALCEALFDLSPSAEFWEVRFWVCLDRRLWNLVEKRQATRDNEMRMADRFENTERDDESDDPFSRMADVGSGPDVLAERKEAIALLTENERISVYLRYIEGMPEESEDPDRPSIAKVLGVTGRSVRNYLRRAEAKLKAWEQGEEIKPVSQSAEKRR